MGKALTAGSAEDRAWIRTLAELAVCRAAQASHAAARASAILQERDIGTQWQASKGTQQWKARLVEVDQHTGARRMCTEAVARNKGQCTEAEELIWRAFSPLPEKEGVLLRKRWTSTTATIGLEELEKYLQG